MGVEIPPLGTEIPPEGVGSPPEGTEIPPGGIECPPGGFPPPPEGNQSRETGNEARPAGAIGPERSAKSFISQIRSERARSYKKVEIFLESQCLRGSVASSFVAKEARRHRASEGSDARWRPLSRRPKGRVNFCQKVAALLK